MQGRHSSSCGTDSTPEIPEIGVTDDLKNRMGFRKHCSVLEFNYVHPHTTFTLL